MAAAANPLKQHLPSDVCALIKDKGYQIFDKAPGFSKTGERMIAIYPAAHAFRKAFRMDGTIVAVYASKGPQQSGFFEIAYSKQQCVEKDYLIDTGYKVLERDKINGIYLFCLKYFADRLERPLEELPLEAAIKQVCPQDYKV